MPSTSIPASMLLQSPLDEAAELAALRSLAASPADGSSFRRATLPSMISIHAFPPEKRTFDALQRLLSASLSRRVTQPETLRWVLALASERSEDLLARAREGPAPGPA